MDKREKTERALDIQTNMLLFAEQSEELRKFRMQSVKHNNPSVAVDEYHYLRITIEDIDTGQNIIEPIFTYRKPADFEAVKDAIARVAMWPDELLAGIERIPL